MEALDCLPIGDPALDEVPHRLGSGCPRRASRIPRIPQGKGWAHPAPCSNGEDPRPRTPPERWRGTMSGRTMPPYSHELPPRDGDPVAAAAVQPAISDGSPTTGSSKRSAAAARASSILAEDLRNCASRSRSRSCATPATISAEALGRLRREVEAAARLNHPGICGVHEAVLDGPNPFIAMNYVEGRTLAEAIAAEQQRRRPDRHAPARTRRARPRRRTPIRRPHAERPVDPPRHPPRGRSRREGRRARCTSRTRRSVDPPRHQAGQHHAHAGRASRSSSTSASRTSRRAGSRRSPRRARSGARRPTSPPSSSAATA